MKRLAFMVAGLCLCGAAVAQDAATTSVEGSNTGVVIKKTQVKSLTSNYQLLVVPVKGHNIAEGDATDDGILLSSMLPPATYNGMTVTIVSCPDIQITAGTAYSASGSAWDQDPTLPAGTIFWLSPTATNYNLETLADTDAPIVFCGNANETGIDWANVSEGAGQMIALGNSTSDAIKISGIPVKVGAQLFRIKAGSTDYQLYRCIKPRGGALGWFEIGLDGSATAVSADATIPAAEAFFYYNP